MDLKNLVAAENAEMAAQSMLHSLGKSKLRLGVSMKKDIGAAHVEAIGTMFARDIGKQKLAASQYVYSRVASNKDATQDALATAQNLREIGSVVMLQRCWRASRARKRQLALKAKQTCLMETGAALHLQGVWRRRQAKKRLEGLKIEAIQIRATELLQRVVRGLLCRQRMQKLIRTIRPHTAYLTMSELSLGKSDTKTCEVLVVVSTYSADSGWFIS